jgi:hypothetical protein
MPNAKKKTRTLLTSRELDFVGAFKGSVLEAARLVGMDKRYAQRLVKRPHVMAAIQKKADAAIAQSGKQLGKDVSVNAANVIKELARLAFYDPRKFFNENGSAKPITELDDDTAMALAGFEMIEQFDGSGKDKQFSGYLKKFKISDKGQNLERLVRYLESSGQLLPKESTIGGASVYRFLQTRTVTVSETKAIEGVPVAAKEESKVVYDWDTGRPLNATS